MQVMSLAFDGFGSLKNLRNLACKLCLWHLVSSEIRGMLDILRAGYVSGISWFQKSGETDEFCVQAMSLAFGAFGNPRK